MCERRLNFPFSAIVDQDRLKLALLLNAINPSIGGLLVRGPKGSGKSMAVRALEDLLPEVEVVADCPFNCSPTDPSNMCSSCRSRWEAGENIPVKKRKMRVITLSLGATEDRVVGTLDMEKALREGVKALQPGILAEANQNVLYVDEINLLPDHIVDDLLDAAASRWNIVDREGISVAHPSRFILIGTMNPEEGELRPQLLDRLPTSVTLHTILDVDKRVEIVKRNLEFRRDPLAFIKKHSAEQERLRSKILKAKELLEKIEVPDSIVYLASAICSRLEVDGQRPDIIMAEVARTIAALNGRMEIEPQDVLEAAKLVLNHRTRKGGFEGPPTEKEIEDAYQKSRRIYREVEAKASKKEDAEEASQTSFQEKRSKPPMESKGFSILRTTPEVKEDANKLKPGVRHGARPSKLGDKDVLGGFPSRLLQTLNILFELGFILLLIGFGIYRRVDQAVYLGFVLFSFLTAHLLLFLWMRKKIPPIVQTLIFLGVHLKGPRTGRDELFEGVPLKGKLKTWIDSRLKMLPDIRVKGSGRSFLAGKRGISLTTLTRGRYKFYEKPAKLTGDIALFPTIQAAIMNRHIKLEEKPSIQVQPEDVRTKIRVYRAPVTIILVLDVSGSMVRHLDVIAKAVSILNREAYRKRDRLALIAFKEGAAHILNDPTTNINVVAGNIRKLKASGGTPLAEGMMKALEVVKNERRRNKDIIPLVVIISDFLPNVPLKMRGHIDPTADTLYVAKLLKRNKIPVIIINTLGWPASVTNIYAGGSVLAKEVAKISGGRYYWLPRSPEKLGRLISEIILESGLQPESPAYP